MRRIGANIAITPVSDSEAEPARPLERGEAVPTPFDSPRDAWAALLAGTQLRTWSPCAADANRRHPGRL